MTPGDPWVSLGGLRVTQDDASATQEDLRATQEAGLQIPPMVTAVNPLWSRQQGLPSEPNSIGTDSKNTIFALFWPENPSN